MLDLFSCDEYLSCVCRFEGGGLVILDDTQFFNSFGLPKVS